MKKWLKRLCFVLMYAIIFVVFLIVNKFFQPADGNNSTKVFLLIANLLATFILAAFLLSYLFLRKNKKSKMITIGISLAIIILITYGAGVNVFYALREVDHELFHKTESLVNIVILSNFTMILASIACSLFLIERYQKFLLNVKTKKQLSF